jgi:hypothetical protein
VADNVKYSDYAFLSMGLSDHGTLEISSPLRSYLSQIRKRIETESLNDSA